MKHNAFTLLLTCFCLASYAPALSVAPSTNGVESFSLCVEAEDSNGPGPVTDDPNASNGKTRGSEHDWNHYVDYAVNGVLASGEHQLTIRYYAAGDARVKVSVNGVVSVAEVVLPATHSWNIVWAEKTIKVTLQEGNNTVRIQGLEGYSTRQDKICVTEGDVPSTPFLACIEAEDSNGDGPVSEDPNASNGKTRGAENAPGHYVDYQVTGVRAAGWHLLTIRYYAAGDGVVNISVNGDFGRRTGLPATNSWNIVWAERTIRIQLSAGNNKIRIAGEPGYGSVRQDKICVRGDGGTDNPFCDFAISTETPNDRPVCSGPLTLRANCVGFDCNAVTYQWTGNGIDQAGRVVDVNAPAANGTFTYTVTATKNDCAVKTATIEVRVSNCEGVEEPYSTCIEAENASGSGPVTADPNASNGLTRGAENNFSHYMEYPVTGVQVAGIYQLTLRYYAAGIANVRISVNGNVAIASAALPSTYSWNIVWREETLNIPLEVGNNVVRIQGISGASCRQDKICVSGNASNARMGAWETAEVRSDGSELQAYPNPSGAEFYADFYLNTGQDGTLKVVDVQGRLWHERKLKGKGAHHERIVLEGAPSGIYLMQMKKGTAIETKKILLSH
jgi:hypothetical protein